MLGMPMKVSAAATTTVTYHVLQGPDSSGCFGLTVSGVDDVNEDGFRDFAIGAPSECTVGPYPLSIVRIFSGLSGLQLREIPEPVAGSLFGTVVIGLRALETSGAPAIVIGAPAEPEASGVGSGAAYVYNALTGQLIRRLGLGGTGTGFQELGRSIAAIGDIDGDGVGDLAIGAPDVVGAGSGAVYVFSGADGSRIFKLTGALSNSKFGSSVLGLGDINADGHPDILVGDSGRGAVYAFSGLDYTQLFSVQGGASFGASMAMVGDLDGDGLRDICVGAPFADGTGTLSYISSAVGSFLRTLAGPGPYSGFGSAVASLGDIDGDNNEEVGVGAPFEGKPEGCCYGAAYIFSSLDDALLARIAGPEQFNAFGSSLATSDTNADGSLELIVGAQVFRDTLQVGAGRAAVFGFRPLERARAFTWPTVGSLQLGAGLGTNEIHLQPETSLGGWSAQDLVPETLVLRHPSFSYEQLVPGLGNIRVGDDADQDGIPEAVAILERTRVRAFVSRASDRAPGDTVWIEASLGSGKRVRGQLIFRTIDPVAPQFSIAPNPTRGSAALTLKLARPGYVTVRIYDGAGKLARRILDREWMSAGYRDLSLDAALQSRPRLNSGIYFVHVLTSAGDSARRLVVVR